MTDGAKDVVLATRQGRAIRFHEDDVRAMGRTAGGVRGMKLKKGDAVVSLTVAAEDASLLTLCENGYGKRTSFDEYPTKHRGGQGVLDIKTEKRNGDVVTALEVTDDDELMMVTEQGMMVRIPVKSVRPIGRNTKGVRLITCAEGDKVGALARVVPGEEDEEEEEGTEPA
jgi:DNA gyrase subunit A